MARTRQVIIEVHEGVDRRRRPDELVVEEPLEIRLDGQPVATTMRTPGHDGELAVGFCHAEGLIDGVRVRRVRHCGDNSGESYNVVDVETAHRAPPPTPRLGLVSSSCGLCGSTSLDALRERLRPLMGVRPPEPDRIWAGIEAVRAAQELFDRTGAVHAAGLIDAEGQPVLVREDIGRHNAVDKVVGRLRLDGLVASSVAHGAPPADGLGGMGLVVSGRASFEMVQKAWAAGIGTVVAVSAPSALAVEAARVAGMGLFGFARSGRLNLYT